MEITVNRADLIRELGYVLPAVEKRGSVPILGNLLLEAAGDELKITGTNLELTQTCTCLATVRQNGRTTLPAKRLFDYVRLLPPGEVTLKVSENHWATITWGRSRTRIAGIDPAAYPDAPEFPGADAVELSPSVLKSLIQQTQFAISTSETRYTLKGALFVMDDNGTRMVATDGHRLAYALDDSALPEGRQPFSALIPQEAMVALLRLMDAPDETKTILFSLDACSTGHLYFDVAGRRLAIRKMDGHFPDFERLFVEHFPCTALFPKAGLRAALERVSQFSDDHTRAITLQLSPGEIRISAAVNNAGESEEGVPVEYEGAPVEIGFNATYLLDCLKVMDGDKARMLLSDPDSAAELRRASDDNYRYIVMPMRVG